MFSGLSGPEGFVFDQFRRLQEEMDELFGQWGSPTGIRSLPRGSFPAVNVGASPDKLEVYLFVPGVDPKRLDISIQQSASDPGSVKHVIQRRTTHAKSN